MGALQSTKSRSGQYGVVGRFVFKYAFTARELRARYKIFGDGKVCKGQSSTEGQAKIRRYIDALQQEATH